MIILRRVVGGVTENFNVRVSEWTLSGALVAWGWILLGETPVFLTSAVWSAMAAIMREEAWGYLAVGVGVARLLALTVNGTFRGTAYSDYSPHVRCGMSLLGCFVWAQIALGLGASGQATTGLAVYPALFITDAWNAVRAAGEAGAQRRVIQNASHRLS